jgi:hypothetical protein
VNVLIYWLIASSPFVLVTCAWAFGRRASYHRGAAFAFQQVSDDFRGLSNATWLTDKAKQKAERKKAMLSLCLCDPKVCDALDEALTEAREHWKHPA